MLLSVGENMNTDNIRVIRECSKQIHAIEVDSPEKALVIIRDALAEALCRLADELDGRGATAHDSI